MAYNKELYGINGGKLLDKNGEVIEFYDLFLKWNNAPFFGALGLLQGIKTFYKFGKGTATTTLGMVWQGSGDIYLPTSAEELFLISDPADNGKKINIIGLDENWEEKEMDVVINSTSQSIGSWTRINRAHNNDPLKFSENIEIQNGTSDVLALVIAERGTTEQSLYTVPAGYVALITGFSADGARGNEITVYNFYKPFGLSERSTRSTELYRNNKDKTFVFPTFLDEKTDIYQKVESQSGTVDVSTTFEIVLINKTELEYFTT